MASYTELLATIVEAGKPIGLDDYPIFDENYRELLNKHITQHYWLYEIGLETVQQFAHQMSAKMHDIMPLYNQLYESQLLELGDVLSTVDMAMESNNSGLTESVDETVSTNSGESNTESKSRAVNSETPQNTLASNGDYATSLADSTGKSTVGTDNESRGTNTNTANVSSLAKSFSKGRQGSVASLLNEYRSTFINVDLMVIGELEPLFMGVMETGEEYSRLDFANMYSYLGWPLSFGRY